MRDFSKELLVKTSVSTTVKGKNIFIPEDATNGDVIEAMFPKAEVYVQEWKDFKSIVVWFENAQVSHDFTWKWWNAKYKG